MKKVCVYLVATLFVSCGFALGQENITFYPSERSNGIGINAPYVLTVERVEDRFGVANKAFKLTGEGGISTGENFGENETFELNGSSMSFSLWLKVDENQTAAYPHVFRFGDEDGWPSIALELNRNTNILGAIHDVSSGVQKRVNASPLQFGSWYHAAIVTENDQFHFYLNGSLIGSSSLLLPVTGPQFWTGGTVPFAAGGFEGTLDEIRVFDYALNADSVEALADGQIPEPVSEKGLRLSRIPGSGYARLEQEILIENGKRYKTIIEIEGEYEKQPADKLPHLCPGCFEFNFDSYTVEFDGSITTIEGVFISDKNGLYDLSLALWSVPQLKFRKVELIDLTTQQNLISNSNFAEGLQGWKANGGIIELYDLDTEPVSENGLRLSRIPGSGYARLEQEILIENGKRYKTIIEIEGEYEKQPADKLPHLCPGCFEFNFDSYTVEFDGSITTIEGVFTSDKNGIYDLSLALWSVPQLKFRKVELIDLTTQQNLISNSNFAEGLQGWKANGGAIELYDLDGPVIYTLTGAASPNGSVTGYGEFESGSEITLTATPNLGYRFTGWTGSVNNFQNPLSVTMNQDLTVGASFTQDTRDADNDGLTNYAELVVYGSDPNDNDTDDDGIPDGAEVNAGLNILQPESISEAVAFLTAVRDEVIVQRDERPTFEQLIDSRLGSVVLVADAETNKVKLRFCIEESDELGQWITREEEAEVEVPLLPGKKFFRFSVKKD